MTKDLSALLKNLQGSGEAGYLLQFISRNNPNTGTTLAAIQDTKSALMTAILDTQNGLSIKQQIQLLS